MKRIRVINSGKEIKNEEQTKITHKNYRNNRKNNKKKIKTLEKRHITNQNGITLLVLSITIIVLLILAGITISAITGDNGIIQNAGQAKKETEIANEKEILEKAIVQVMGNNKYGNIEEKELQEQLDKETGDGKTKAVDIGDEFEVLFTESKRYYTVDKQGNVEGAYEFIEDKYPGNITVGVNGETLDGNTEKTAYQILCIEDLVKFSQMVNEENQNFLDKYVVLKTNLDFKSNFSYMNPNTTEFDIYLGGNGQTSLIEQLSEDGNGFVPIGRNYSTKVFGGDFDGENHLIKNVYINQNSDAGLFGVSGGGKNFGGTNITQISNLTVEGNVTVNSMRAGGIVAYAAYGLVIENCHSLVNITGKAYGMGGVIGTCQYGGAEIINCSNSGTLDNQANATGGIIGTTQSNINIVNTYNLADINGNGIVGGLAGILEAKVNIYNCYQVGNVTGNSSVGGIIGEEHNTINLRNAYTIGNVNCSSSKGAIIGRTTTNSIIDCNYVYYKKINNIVGIYNENDADFKINGYTEDEWNSTQIADFLNQGRQQQEVNIDKQEWKIWSIGGEGYPVF